MLSDSVEYSDGREVDIFEDSDDEFSDSKLIDFLTFQLDGSLLDVLDLSLLWCLLVVDEDDVDPSLSVCDADDVRI